MKRSACLLRRGTRVFEVPVSYRARGRKEGKKLEAMDEVRVSWTLLRCRFDAQAGSPASCSSTCLATQR